MVGANDGVVERMFEQLTARDWNAFGDLLTSDVVRIGPFGERLAGRDAYVELMAGSAHPIPADDQAPTTWDLHGVAYTDDRRSAFARVTAHVPRNGGEMLIEQTLAYKLDEHGLISQIEVFWRDPRR